MKHTTKVLVLIATIVGAASLATAGWAFWSTAGSGSASASVATLVAPGEPHGTPTTGAVALSWTTGTPAPPGGVDGYYVQRNNGSTTANACGTSSSPRFLTTSLACNDTNLSAGSYTYTVTAVFKSWTAVSAQSASITVTTVGPAAKLAFTSGGVSGQPSGNAIVGPITIQQRDASNQPVNAGAGGTIINLHSDTAGTQTFSRTSGGAVVTSVTIPSGSSSVSFYYGDTKAGTPTITASSSGLMSATQRETINAGPAASLSLGAESTSPTAGTSDKLTITAQDAFQNIATSYTGSKNLSFGGASVIGTNNPTVSNGSGAAISFGGTTAITFTSGVASPSGGSNGVMKLYKAETATVTVTDGTINNSTGLPVTVNPGAANSFSVATPTMRTAGTAFSETITAVDLYSNTATAYSGSKTILFAGPANSPNNTAPAYPGSVTFTGGTGTASITLYNAASNTLSATEGTITGTSGSFTVNAATTSQFQVSNPGTQTAGTAFSASLTALDQWKNPSSYTGAHTIAWSGAANAPDGTPPLYPATATGLTFSNGSATATGIKAYKAGATTLAATEGTVTGSSGSFNVNAGTAANLAWTNVTVSGGTLSSPCLFGCTDTALGNNGTFTANVSVTDLYGNIVNGVGSGHTVTVSTPASGAGSGGAFAPSGTSVALTISSTGAATSTAQFTFKAQTGNWTSDTFTAATSAGTVYTNVSATVTKQ